MPPRNPTRPVTREQLLARRVQRLRLSSAMSYEELAERMSDSGCPIQASALYKIEKGNPPRRIVVDELVAFSKVFGVPIVDLVSLPSEARSAEEVLDRAVNAYFDLEQRRTASRLASMAEHDAHERFAAIARELTAEIEGLEPESVAAVMAGSPPPLREAMERALDAVSHAAAQKSRERRAGGKG